MIHRPATTAMLAAKSFYALTQFKLDGRNVNLRELEQKKLWMKQQAEHDFGGSRRTSGCWTLDA